MTLKDESPRSEGVWYDIGKEWRRITNIIPQVWCVWYATEKEQRRITSSSRKKEVAGPKQKWCLVVDVPDDGKKSNAVKYNIA